MEKEIKGMYKYMYMKKYDSCQSHISDFEIAKISYLIHNSIYLLYLKIDALMLIGSSLVSILEIPRSYSIPI